VKLHWRRLAAQPTDGFPLESTLEAIEQVFHCSTPVATVIVADSALNLGLVTVDQLAAVLGGTRRGDWVLDRVDGSSASGIETIARVALRGRRVRMRSQVAIPGIGRVDLVIGDRLILELDGFEWHSGVKAFEADRKRDLDLALRGYLVVRVPYRRVVEDWAAVEADLLTLVRREEHLWRARHRALHNDG
jgi:very-short-patch-repair endonuclease